MTESEKEKALKELMQMPGFGRKSAEQLWDLGIHSIAELKNKDPLVERSINDIIKKIKSN